MKKNISFVVTIILVANFLFSQKILAGNNNNWGNLKNFLLSNKEFWMPPNEELLFKRNNVVFSVGVTHRKTFYKKGTWLINHKIGYIDLRILYANSTKSFKKRYYSFNIIHKFDDGKRYSHVLLFTGKKFKMPVDFNEKHESGKYLELHVQKR